MHDVGLKAVASTLATPLALPVTVPNGGTGAASFTAGEILFGDDANPISHSPNLTWSATTGLLSKKGISSKLTGAGIGSEVFGLGAYDSGTGVTTNNTVLGAGAGVTQTYGTICTIVGAGSTGVNQSTVIGQGSSDTGGGSVVVGFGLSNSSSNSALVGTACSASSGGILAFGYACAAGFQDAGAMGWGNSALQQGELSWGVRQTASEGASFRLSGCTSTQYTGAHMWRVNNTWIDATNATRKARAILSVYDTAEREYLRADSNGSGVNVMMPNLKLGNTTAASAILQLIAGTATASTGPLKFSLPGVPLTVPELGVLETSAEKLLYTKTSLIREALVGCIFTQTADATVTNTVTETSIVGAGVGYGLTLPANFFIIGKTIRLRIGGIYTTPAIATPSVVVKIKYGTTVLATVTTSSLLSGATALEFDGEIDITCRTTGATGTVSMHGDIEYATGVAGTIAVDALNNAGATKTIDTTAASLLDVTIAWDTATATRAVTSTVCTVEVIN